MAKASTETTARPRDKGDSMSGMEMRGLTKLQRLLRAFDQVSWRVPFRPSDSMLRLTQITGGDQQIQKKLSDMDAFAFSCRLPVLQT